MTRLRKMMPEELQRRNYVENTTRSYLRTVEDFSRRCKLPPDRLGPRHIREYQAELFMTLYATGIRNAELTRLKVSDIDSKRMVIHIQGGKGRRDRDVMLSPNCSTNCVPIGTILMPKEFFASSAL